MPTFGICVVVPPELPNLVLAAHVPHGEGDAFHRLHGLHVKPDGRDGAHVLIQFDLVQDRCFAWRKMQIQFNSGLWILICIIQTYQT